MTARILYQLTSPMHRTLGTAEIERRREILAGAVSHLTVEIAPTQDGPAAVEAIVDAARVVPELLSLAPSWETAGYDAVVIGCFSDPGVDALRDVVTLPVIGPGASAMHLAAQFGSRFSVLSSSPTPRGLRARTRSLGLGELFVSERCVPCSVLDLARNPAAAMEGIVSVARACMSDGADILVLGCMGMGFIPGLTERIQNEAGVTVVNSVMAGLKTAEAAATLKLRHRPVQVGLG